MTTRDADEAGELTPGRILVAYEKLFGGGRGVKKFARSGLRYVDLAEGTGPQPKPVQTVSVHYTGTLESGVKFDSSRDPGKKPLEFIVGGGNMIKGFDEG